MVLDNLFSRISICFLHERFSSSYTPKIFIVGFLMIAVLLIYDSGEASSKSSSCESLRNSVKLGFVVMSET